MPTPPTPPPRRTRKAYRRAEAAEQIGISVWTLDRLIRDGEIAFTQIPGGRGIIVSAVEIDRFLEDTAVVLS